ncbi:MAG TPA: hypothetical protein GXX24_10075 [Paracoccus solventivorans]|uniref:Uncharacterized protein n=1 Tax=Paracoccus solventivorans TaxID=53463 RepID=A0A832PP62_9RHOB|nr:hypothetical protein [Paracoccus solventivorans]
MTEIADSGALGEIKHVLAEAYDPVVLRARKQNWRTRLNWISESPSMCQVRP